MRIVLQRVLDASVTSIDTDPVEEVRIGSGLLLLAGFQAEDDEATLRWMARKVLGLRIFDDDSGALDRTVVEEGGSILAVPNFTLYGDVRKGRRPSFVDAAPAAVAATLFSTFVAELRTGPVPVEAGFFQAHMHVRLVNDGPITLWLEREPPPVQDS